MRPPDSSRFGVGPGPRVAVWSRVLEFILAVTIVGGLLCRKHEEMEHGEVVWERHYGGPQDEFAFDVLQAGDGGFILVGSTTSEGAGGKDLLLLKTDEDGDQQWTATYGSKFDEEGFSVVRFAEGGYVIAGVAFDSAGNEGGLIVRTDAYGDTVWTRRMGLPSTGHFRSVVQTQDGGLVVAGFVRVEGRLNTDIWLVKLDSSGDSVWARVHGKSGLNERAYSVLEHADGSLFIVGKGEVTSGNHCVQVMMTDARGDMVWSKSHDAGSGREEANSAALAPDSGYLVAGYTESVGAGEADMWLLRLDASGDTVWTRACGGEKSDYCHSVIATDSGFVGIGHSFSFGAGQDDIYIVGLEPAGDSLWARTYGGGSFETGASIVRVGDGDLAVAGWTKSLGENAPDAADMYLLKITD